MRWYATVLIAGILATSGCTQTDNGDDETDGTTGATGTPPLLTVSLTDAPAEAQAGEAFTIQWRVETSSGTVEIPHTGVHWAAESVPTAGSATKPSAYGNTSGAQAATVPGDFSAQVTVDEEGRIYLRSHAMAQNQNYWSNEITIDIVAAEGDGGNGGTGGETHTVQMVSTGAMGFEPNEITIQAGDSVQWENVHSNSHTATSDSGAPAAFDTGNVAPGQTSEPIVFDTPGTYEYICEYHQPLMDGRIVVEG